MASYSFSGVSSLMPEQAIAFTLPAVKAAQEFQDRIKQKAKRLGVDVPGYEAVELIGKGSYGRVYKSRQISTGDLVAVKVIDLDVADYEERSEATLSDIQKEITALKALKDANARNVNMMLEAFVFDADVWLVSQYCTGGSLRTLMRAVPGNTLDQKYMIPIARELAEALRWVHKAGIVHRDIKCANVLINEDGHLQLCDFGVAGTLETKSNKRNTVMGTCHWMPPEMVGRLAHGIIPQGYGTEVDIWSFGCTLYELSTGAPPNSRIAQDDLNDELQTRAPRLDSSKHPPGLCDLVAMCLQRRPRERPTSEGILQHYFVSDTLQTHPVSLLREMLLSYQKWEKAGGERASLWMPGGAPVSEMSDEEDSDMWTFDTVRPSAETVPNEVPSEYETAPSTSSVRDFASRSEPHQLNEARRRIPRNALSRMFDPQDQYNYAQRRRQQGMPMTDLPLREQTRDSQIQDNQIDLGEFDTVPDIMIPDLSIPDINTIRASRTGNRFFRDSRIDEEVPEEFQAEQERNRRATKDWKFPSLPGPAPIENVDARRRTQDWKFPAMTVESKMEPEMETVQETVSAPTSPPRETFSMEDDILRPASAEPTAGPLSPGSLDADIDPFGLETTEDEGRTEVGSRTEENRASFHRQSRSEPSNLDLAAAEAEAALKAATEDYNYNLNESHPDFHTVRGRTNSLISELGTDERTQRSRREVQDSWLRTAEASWQVHIGAHPPESGDNYSQSSGDYPRGRLRSESSVSDNSYRLSVDTEDSREESTQFPRLDGKRRPSDGSRGSLHSPFNPESLHLPMPLPPPPEALIDGTDPHTLEDALSKTIGDLAQALEIFQSGLQATSSAVGK